MPEDEEGHAPEDENVEPSAKGAGGEEASEASDSKADDSKASDSKASDSVPEPEDKPSAPDESEASSKESPAKPAGKTNSEDASEEDAEAAMLAMMEGKEVGEDDSSFDDQLADLPEAKKVSPDAIAYEETVARPANFQQLSGKPPSDEARSIDMLLDVQLPISIELGRTKLTIAEILALGPGSVVELNKLAGEPVEVLVNRKTVALGEVVVVDENFGVRVTQLMSPEDRIKALQE